MSYSKVRTYINQVIASVDSDFKEHKDAFNDENISRNIFDKAYHIAYSVPSITRSDIVIESNVGVTVKFFFKGYNSTIETLDSAMDLVNNVALAAGKIETLAAFRVTDNYPIQACNPTAQTNEPLENNDNSIIVTLELNISVFQTLC